MNDTGSFLRRRRTAFGDKVVYNVSCRFTVAFGNCPYPSQPEFDGLKPDRTLNKGNLEHLSWPDSQCLANCRRHEYAA